MTSSPNAFYLVEYNNFQIRGKTDNQGRISTVLPPNTQFTLSIYDPKSEFLGSYTGNTKASGNSTNISALTYKFVTDLTDTDGEGLVDKAEKIIGTSANKFDTDNDGINDFAEIQQGLDPLGGQGFPTGIIASLPLFGEAKGLVVEGSTTNTSQQIAYVATVSHGLAIVNASQFNNPIILGQLNLPGDATDVAVDSNLQIAAVATNSGGLQLINVADGMLPTLTKTININASQVEIANGIAYVTVGTSLRAIDLLTGEQLQQLTLPGSGTITDLARDGNYLYGYTSGSDTFFTVDISNATAATLKGQLNVFIASFDVGVFAGNGVAYLAGSGLSTVNISNPANPTLISGADNFFTARDVSLNGSGLGLVSQEGLGVGIYSLTNPQNTNNFVTSFNTSGFTYDVAIASGIAYVADGNGGLQVITPLNIQLKNDDRVVQLTYNDYLPIGNYSLVIVTAQVTDRSGNALGTNDMARDV